MRLASVLAAVLLGLLPAHEAKAQQATADTLELPAGGLVYVPDWRLAVEAQEVVLGRDAVRSTYAVRSRASEPLALMMAWQLPEIDMNVISDDIVVLASGDPQNFAAAAVFRDGVPVVLGYEQRAVAFARDVTALLEASGVPLNPRADSVAGLLTRLPPERVAELEERGMVRREDDRLLPNWAVRTTAYWRQVFEPAKLVTLGLAYVPVTASGLWQKQSLAQLRETYCIDDALAARIEQRAQTGGRGIVTHRLTYSMAHNPGWWQPIANFRLVIEKSSVETLVATCFKDLKPVGPTLLEWITRDFRPKDDIRVLFIN